MLTVESVEVRGNFRHCDTKGLSPVRIAAAWFWVVSSLPGWSDNSALGQQKLHGLFFGSVMGKHAKDAPLQFSFGSIFASGGGVLVLILLLPKIYARLG